MSISQNRELPPLRLWPGVLLVAVQWVARYVVPRLIPEAMPFAVLGSLALGLAVVVWWLFFSRASRWERWGGLASLVLAFGITQQFLHESIASTMMGLMFPIYAIPSVCLVLVLWAIAAERWPRARRWGVLAVALLVTCFGWLLVRTNGMTGAAQQDFAWRWTETAEERLLAQDEAPLRASASVLASGSVAEWPGFRGAGRDSVVTGLAIATDWNRTPPMEVWRQNIGPAVSSFAVQGERIFTQEQRGEEELVSCYHRRTGEPLWKHRDAVRFWDSHAGAGPRATPTLYGGRVYSLGGTGLLNALDATSGDLLWSRDAAGDLDRKAPGWGFAGSPLVTDELVFVALAGELGAYERESGELRWRGPAGRYGYSSPHLLERSEGAQVVLMSSFGATAFGPDDGEVLWEVEMEGTSRIVQPGLTADGDLLLSDGEGRGLRRHALTADASGWKAEERWSTNRFKPYFNDFVVHGGHAYGFDGPILASVDLADGQRNWKGGRYGNGQLLLLADQDLLLVLSEQGDLALVSARPDGFEEVARFDGALDGKTWNHPALVDDLLLVRNGVEMAAFRLPRAAG
ncbi:MAG: PQQ-binding-like beta-propeller repeat protein [Acidobacteriota bacterium]